MFDCESFLTLGHVLPNLVGFFKFLPLNDWLIFLIQPRSVIFFSWKPLPLVLFYIKLFDPFGQLQSLECWKSWPPWWWKLQYLLLTFISRVWSFDINDKINLKRKKMISMPLMENPVRKPMVPQWDSAGWYAMHHNKNILEKLYTDLPININRV